MDQDTVLLALIESGLAHCATVAVDNGGLVAALSTFIMFHVRTGITRATGLPDLSVALAEDAVILGAYFMGQGD